MKYGLLLFIVMVSGFAVAAQDPAGKRAHIDAVMKCVASDDLACVVDLSTKGVELYPTDGGFRYTRGVGYLRLGKYPEALADESKAIELSPQFSDAFYIRAIVYETGYFDFNKALADLSTTLKLDANSVNALAERGKLYKFEGQLDLAAADFQKLLAIDASSADAKFNLTDISDMKKAGFNTGPVKDNVLLLYTEYIRRFDDASNLLSGSMNVVGSAMDEKPVNIVKLCKGVNGMAAVVIELEKNAIKLEALLKAGRFDKIPVYRSMTQKKIDGYETLRPQTEKLNVQFQCGVSWQ